MDIQLIRSDKYKKIMDDFVKPYAWKNVVQISEFPFEKKKYYLEKMEDEPSINNFNLIKKLDVIYDIDKRIYGILNLNDIDYIVSVDNEFTIEVVGDTESNWLWIMFYSNDHVDKFEVFMMKCYKQLGIEIKEPDFENNFYKVEEKFLEPLIWGAK